MTFREENRNNVHVSPSPSSFLSSERSHVMAIAQEQLRDMTSKKTACTGDENVHTPGCFIRST
jgi:hypothetical protein